MPGFSVLHYLQEFAQIHVHWVNDAIQPSHPVVPFSRPESFPASRSFPMSQLFPSGGQSIGAPASILPMNIQDWFPLGLTGLIPLQSKGLSSLLQHHNLKEFILQWLAFFMVQLLHPHMTTGKTIALTRWTFVGKVMSLLFNMLSRLVITFLPRSKRLLISWLQSPSAGILESQKIVCHCFHCFPISPFICHEVDQMGPDAIILVFWMFSFKATFPLFFNLALFSNNSHCFFPNANFER